MTTTTQTEPIQAEDQRNVRGWTVTLAALGINLVLGVLYAWGVIAKALVGNWHWSKTEASLPFTAATATFAITMIFAGRAQDIIGPRFITLFGGLVLGGALIASSFVTTPLGIMITFGVIGGIGIGLGYSATTPPAIKWFPPQRKGLITGIVVSGVGIAAVYIGPVTEFLLARNTISRTFLILGIGAMVLVAILCQFISNPPAGYKPPVKSAGAAPAAAAARAPQAEMNLARVLRTSQFYILWAMFVLAASAGLMIIAHVAIIAKEQAGLKWGFMPIALLAVFNTLGRVLSGYVSDVIGRRNTMILAFGLQAINMFLFARYNTPGLLLFGAAFTGLCYGTIFTVMPASVADFYGLRNLGVNYGTLFTAFGVAGVFGPMLAGRIRDSQGNYAQAFAISAVLLLVGTVLAFLLKAPRQEQTAA